MTPELPRLRGTVSCATPEPASPVAWRIAISPPRSGAGVARRGPEDASRGRRLAALLGGGRRGRPGGLFHEGRDQLGGALGLVEGHERVAVLDQLQARVREGARQPLGVADLEEAVLG